MGDAISFRCPDGSDCAGYLAEAPIATKGIVVLQEASRRSRRTSTAGGSPPSPTRPSTS
jgi:hypothetical protein